MPKLRTGRVEGLAAQYYASSLGISVRQLNLLGGMDKLQAMPAIGRAVLIEQAQRRLRGKAGK